jgi:uncharacterized membrane protein
MRIVNELPELVENEVISADTAKAIEQYYATRKVQGNSQMVIFGALGAILVGLGIILIFAHNWDDFSRVTRTILAIAPLVVFQILTGYSILKNKSRVWKEASGTLLFFSIGAAIALVGQIYNIPGSQGNFLLTWTLLGLPLLYLLSADTIAVLYLVFSTYYAVAIGYFNPHSPWMYLALIAAFVPYYRKKLRNQGAELYSASVFNWMVPLSLTIALGAFISGADEFGFVIYIAFLCLMYNISRLPFFKAQLHGWNGYLHLGRIGIALLLLSTSFRWFWKSRLNAPLPEMHFVLIWLAFFIGALYVAYVTAKGKYRFDWYQAVIVIFPVIYLMGTYNDLIPAVLNNLLVLCMGVAAIKEGADRMDFSILNFGLLIISGLIISRFFDTNMSFAVRGLLFIAVGAGFFLANYLVIKKKRINLTNRKQQ